ncbi:MULTISPECIES: hypothetical protein [Vibrio]|uniref:hypothetical protein n=1 Tax=Vibrio TaxID=662 RepID=UPI0008419CD3|nr:MULTISPECIES: hypothetical protein [Vibrio]ODM56869.1 hypothetical protein BC455_18590 [Vibrio harveyi]USD58490.1 hypothetical protein J4N44_27745 [Vibrio sp. SCSIO 43155]
MNKQRGFALTDVQFGLTIYILVTVLIASSTAMIASKIQKHNEAKFFSEVVFDAMETFYWNEYSQQSLNTRCLSTSTINPTLTDLESYLPQHVTEDGWLSVSTARFRFIRLANTARTQLAMEIEVDLIGESSSDYLTVNGVYSAPDSDTIIFRKEMPFEASNSIIVNLDSNGCTS